VSEAALVLFWPAAFAYGEAALAYTGEVFRPGRPRRLAIWGVRLGWLAQTALLVAQAASTDGFPWASWAGSLNLFVWMCVGAYLVWGCRSSFALLGLGVMPLALVLFVLAWAAGGAGAERRSDFGNAFLAAHVGLVLAAFAGFTLAAALAGLYLWQERRLKRRATGVLRLRAPSLAALDRLTGRTIAVALPLLTAGIGIGFARLEAEGRGFDPVVALSLVAWVLYGAFLALRLELGWRGRRTAWLALAGFLVVIVLRLAVTPMGHFS
jgi:ABC-type uncharacterized transport system permease subunit